MRRPRLKISYRFPRPRGDGPRFADQIVFDRQVPPPTRGWSHPGHRTRPRCWGSPAHAGMVPSTTGMQTAAKGFPRPRGDGPFMGTVSAYISTVPPPTRGWSRIIFTPAARVRGSPAHAGMVPPRFRPPFRALRFPRPRGDGPATSDSPSLASPVPPPTRGWSLYEHGKINVQMGSPAHAGMVLITQGGKVIPLRFPRPRGDGPGIGGFSINDPTVPPPTRGWSLKNRPRPVRLDGSPAHAGMVPHDNFSGAV